MQENWVVYQDNLKVRELKREEMDEIKQLSVLSKGKLLRNSKVRFHHRRWKF
ncbi:hypothetical protein ACIP9G_04060 [Lysinibacillus sp. NPDC093197]|uniref:hypothetical protein n=1 Tax=Lysinibacillus sp. NPDC093197 TaxID=3364132 RepID=UPI00380BA92F